MSSESSIASGPFEDLSFSPESVARILRSAPIGISITRTRDGRCLDINKEFLRILGLTREETLGRTGSELGLWVFPRQREGLAAELQARGRIDPRPVSLRRSDGTAVTVLFSASNLDLEGETHAVAWAVDITDRIRTEEALSASETRWRSLAENAPIVILTLDGEGSILTINRSITGRPADEYLGRKAFDFLHPDHRERGAATIASVMATMQTATGEFPLLRQDGSSHWFQVSVAPLAPGPTPERVILVATDIDARRGTEQALRESEQRFADIVRSLGEWVWEANAAGQITYSSPQVAEVLGYQPEEMLGKTPLDTAVPEDFKRLESTLRKFLRTPRPFRNFEEWHLHKDGRRVCISVSGVPVLGPSGEVLGFRGVIQDVTERRRAEEERHRMEEEVHQARRVESLGMMAGGIAHDFNNLLTAILGNAELALATLPEDADLRPLIDHIQTAAGHAAELTRQMLSYAGRSRVATRRIDLTATVLEISELLAASVPKGVEIDFELGDGLPVIEADPGQIRQVVMNLVINGAEAMEGTAGRITVRTAAGGKIFKDADLVLGKFPRRRKTVQIDVADTGKGMDRKTIERIFDPFYTTKFTGRGLGLAAVQGIVLRHGGVIAVRSLPGNGSVFRVLFAAAGPPGSAAPAPTAAKPAAEPLQGGGRVLVVDDEESVRTMTARMLEAIGFQAVTAAGGAEALALLADPGEDVRAVLLDLTMPRMNGEETFRQVRRLRADIPVILCSGYDLAHGAQRFTGMDFAGFLQKPYRVTELSESLRSALGA